MNDTIHIPLLNEGTAVWRPAPAHRLDASTYIVLRPDSYDPDDEEWEFPPGSVVICQPTQTDKGTVLAAVRRAASGRQTA